MQNGLSLICFLQDIDCGYGNVLLGANFPPKPTGLNLSPVRRGSGLCDTRRVSQLPPLGRFLFAPKAHLTLTLGVRGACAV